MYWVYNPEQIMFVCILPKREKMSDSTKTGKSRERLLKDYVLGKSEQAELLKENLQLRQEINRLEEEVLRLQLDNQNMVSFMYEKTASA